MSEQYVTRKEFEDFISKLPKEDSKEDPKEESKKVQRAPTEYNLFVQSESKKIREKNPGIKAHEVMKKCGEAWQALKANK